VVVGREPVLTDDVAGRGADVESVDDPGSVLRILDEQDDRKAGVGRRLPDRLQVIGLIVAAMTWLAGHLQLDLIRRGRLETVDLLAGGPDWVDLR
jgi:hypothetical protein